MNTMEEKKKEEMNSLNQLKRN